MGMTSHLNFLTKKRRSVRKYLDAPIDPEKLKDIVDSGLRAPTSKNNRSTHFTIVEDKALITQLSQCRKHGSAFLEGAPVVIVVSSDSSKSARPYSDCATAASFMMLAVADNDLGACWCHVEDSPHPDGGTAEAYIRGLLGMPSEEKILCMLGIGEVAEHGMLEPRERMAEWERVFIGRFGRESSPEVAEKQGE